MLKPVSRRAAGWAALLSLGLVLLIGLPQFARMPLYCDTTHWDIGARSVLQGGVFYRDTAEMNLPGMLWVHLAVRPLFGWAPEAMRVADLLMLTGVVWLLLLALKRAGVSWVGQVWTAVALYAFYLSAGEDCHCQRDPWMLLPAAVALGLRGRQMARLDARTFSARRLVPAAVLEGACWGAAFWIKPHVIVVGASCWALSLACGWRTAGARRRLADAAGLLVGGLAVGGLGCAWLWETGAWPHFWKSLLSSGLEYSSWSAPKWTLRALVAYRLAPWTLAYLVAVPVAAVWVYRSARAAGGSAGEEGLAVARERGLLGCFFLAWLLQADLLQHGVPYHHVPALLLALTVAACWSAGRPMSLARWATLFLFTVCAAGAHPALKWERLSAWGRCFLREGDAELKDLLALTGTTDWQDLERAAAYLRSQGLRDGELNCYGTYTIPLYLRLQIQPATRFDQFTFTLGMFPGLRETLYREADASPQRYVVSDVRDPWAVRLAWGEGAGETSGPPPALPPPPLSPAAREYPWSAEVVFRSGRYCVHKVTRQTLTAACP
jgi:hypothetical protein